MPNQEQQDQEEKLKQILAQRSYKEFIKSNNDKQYTVKVALVIIKNIEKYTPNYVFSTPEARQFKARSGLAIS